MKTTLEDELKYVDRCINPDYIIIIQNKADDKMDFSQFKVIGLEDNIVISQPKRYIIGHDKVIDFEGNETSSIAIWVYDNFEKRTVVRVQTKDKHQEKWEEKFKKDYGSRSVLREMKQL